MSTRQGASGLTMADLERAATTYLARYATSGANLRRVLMRRVAKIAREDDVLAEEGRALVEALIARYFHAGLLDDRRFAEAKVASLARAGASRFQMRGRLMQKGVARDEIDAALGSLDAEGHGSEAAAAAIFMRRKHLGPYRPPEARARHSQKDLAALTRAGFGLGLARRLLRAADVEALERMAQDED